MVFNLVIQSAIPEISDGMRSHIARTEHLLMQKVQRIIFLRNEHTFMIGSGNRAKIQAKKRPVDDKEKDGLPECQAGE